MRYFNCLPQAVVAAETVAKFKRKLSNVDLSYFKGIILIVRPKLVGYKRLLIQPVHTINLSVFFTRHFYCFSSCF